MKPVGMTTATSLLEAFSVLPAPCLARGREHGWSEWLFIAVCTRLTGGESFYDMEEFACLREGWPRTFLALPGGPPSPTTRSTSSFRLWTRRPLPRTFATWIEGLRAVLPADGREIVAVDGKAARRAVHAGEDTRCLVLKRRRKRCNAGGNLTAWAWATS